jgi:hypothetical protein
MNIETNYTENTQIALKFDKSNLKNPDGRDGGSLKTIVDGKTSESNSQLNVSDTGSFFRVTVGTQFQSSSLHTNDEDASVTYTLTGDSTDDSGGGGVGSPTSEDQLVYWGTGETEEGVEQFSVPFGTETTRSLTVTNERQSDTTAQLQVGDQGFCQYVSVQETLNSDQYSKAGTYQLPAAQQSLGQVEASETFNIRFDLPNKTSLESSGINDYSCETSTTASFGTAEPLVIQVDEGFQLTGAFTFLAEDICFNIPFSTFGENGLESNNSRLCIPVAGIGFTGIAGMLGLFVVLRRRDIV